MQRPNLIICRAARTPGFTLFHTPTLTESAERSLHAELVAVLVAVTNGEPRVLTTEDARALPAGPFELSHRSLQAGLRAWVEAQTHHPLGYVEQLYTFADGDRSDESGARVMSVSYLGLTREAGETGVAQVGWQDWYRYFPWEDRRAGTPALVEELIVPRLAAWCEDSADAALRKRRRQRAAAGPVRRGGTPARGGRLVERDLPPARRRPQDAAGVAACRRHAVLAAASE